MDIRKSAQELASTRVATGYRFENGTPFVETLGVERAEALLAGLQDGAQPSGARVQSPSIADTGVTDRETAH
jgi:hypothetical protein